jgi:predicted transcriptional regulator
MKLDNMTDNRYKVNQSDVNDMREFRSLGFTVQEIADNYNISSATVVYWTNDKSRAKQKAKNAKRRRTKKEDISKKIKNDMAKRKLNNIETPRTKIRHTLESRLNDKRNPNPKTIHGMKIKDVVEMKDKGLLQRGNSKIDI